MSDARRPADDEKDLVPWGVKDMVMAGIWAVLLMLVGIALTGLLAWQFGGLDPDQGLQNGGLWVSLVFLLEALLLVPAWYWGPKKYGGGWAALGFRPADLSKGALLVALGFFAIMAVNGVWGVVQRVFDIPGQPEILPAFGEGWLGLARALLLGAVVAPLVEEVFFRGYLYAGLRAALGHWQGLVASSLIFALIHFTPGVIPPIFLMGLVFAWLYDLTDSLWPCIALHGVVNAVALLGAYLIEQGIV